jgi:hypothetical protein
MQSTGQQGLKQGKDGKALGPKSEKKRKVSWAFDSPLTRH